MDFDMIFDRNINLPIRFSNDLRDASITAEVTKVYNKIINSTNEGNTNVYVQINTKLENEVIEDIKKVLININYEKKKFIDSYVYYNFYW